VKPKYTALALTEAIIAVFILAAGFIVTSRLFHQALRYETQISTQQTAVLLAERQMESIRGWSRDFIAKLETHLPVGAPVQVWVVPHP
jgi:Tfp pilus assembly protein PilV